MDSLILGLGFVGQAYIRHVQNKNVNVFYTNRKTFDSANLHSFDFLKQLISEKIPNGMQVFWTFAVSNQVNPEAVVQLYDECFLDQPVIILGTTSSYEVTHPDQEINESTPLKVDEPRSTMEEALRGRGACILRLSGIFDPPERDPLNWYKAYRIGRPSHYLNLIHRDDIVQIADYLFQNFYKLNLSGESFILSNGFPERHIEIVKRYQNLGLLPKNYTFPENSERHASQMSKRISNEKIVSILPQGYKFKTLQACV